MRALCLFCFIFGIVQIACAGGTAVVTVGSDGACDYASITAASFNEPASGLLDIRVAKNFTLSGIQLLADRNTSIRGGYDTCSDPSPSGRTLLQGSGTGPIFVAAESTGTTLRTDLDLYNLEITGGNSNTNGGVVSLTGAWRLIVNNNTFMHNNNSNQDGGAIFIQPSTDVSVLIPQMLIVGNSIVSNNSADNGGAIACDGVASIFAWNMQMAGNDASQNGGAVHATNGCNFTLYGGGFLQGIILNDAVGFGGGIYASNNANVRIQSNLGFGVAAVLSNSAANGGGIAVSNGALLTAADAVISDNSASSTGGAIRSNGGRVVIERVAPGAQCHSEVRCSRMAGNSANGTDPTFSGGGAIATFGGTLEIRGTYIEDNSASYGSAIRTRFMLLDAGLNSPITMVGNVFADNRNASQVVYLDDSSADIAFSTFVDNQDMSRVIEMAYPNTSSEGNEVTVSGSIFSHPGTAVASAELTTDGQLPVGDCNRNEPGSTGDLIGQPRSTTQTVFFENSAAGDYRLLNNSTLVDWCTGSFLGSASNHSANGFARPVDSSVVPNLYGSYDMGGLERYELDLIFADDLD